MMRTSPICHVTFFLCTRPEPSQPPDSQQFPNDPLENHRGARPHPAR